MTREAVCASIIVLAAPAPEIVSVLLTTSSPLDNRYVPAGTMTLSPGAASAIACRSEPGPLSFWFMTMIEPAALAPGGVTAISAATAASTTAAVRLVFALCLMRDAPLEVHRCLMTFIRRTACHGQSFPAAPRSLRCAV
jgi:hypothetical protein